MDGSILLVIRKPCEYLVTLWGFQFPEAVHVVNAPGGCDGIEAYRKQP